MSEVRTGLEAWLGQAGASYANELIRQASRIASELVEQPTSGIPRVVDIIRMIKTQDANPALGVEAQWSVAQGLSGLQATYFQPSSWETSVPAAAAEITSAKRLLLIADVPASGGQQADVILLTDRVRVDDPEFGLIDLDIQTVKPIRGSGLIQVEAVFERC